MTESRANKAENRLEYWALDQLKPYKKNARTHSTEQVKQLAASIVEFGFTNPILATADGDMIAGHGRLEAARELGLKKVPVLILEHLSEAQRKAYVIADNQLALNASWDKDLLQEEVMSLNLLDFNLDLLGFNEVDLSQMLDPEGIDNDESPDDFDEVDEDLDVEHRCPSCGYEWSGKS